MRSIYFFLLPLLFLLLGKAHAFSLAAKQYDLQINPEIQNVIADGKLTVAFVSFNHPPYVYRDKNHQLQGFDFEIAKKLAKSLSVELNPVFAKNYNEAVMLVIKGEADLAISNITPTIERAKYVLFSQPYNTHYLAVLETRANVTSPELNRKKLIQKYNRPGISIGVMDGTMYYDLVKDYLPNAKVVIYDDKKALLKDVINKKISAAISDNIYTRNLFVESPELALLAVSTKVSDWLLADGIAINIAYPEFVSWVNLFLNTLEEDSTLKLMRMQYFHKPSWGEHND